MPVVAHSPETPFPLSKRHIRGSQTLTPSKKSSIGVLSPRVIVEVAAPYWVGAFKSCSARHRLCEESTVTPSRYRESRTLVRRLCRLPGESPIAFRAKRSRLRQHFEQFNRDAARLCQWLFGLRGRAPNAAELRRGASFGQLGDLLLYPSVGESDSKDEPELDRRRLALMDDLLGLRRLSELGAAPIAPSLRAAIEAERRVTRHPGEAGLFDRLSRYQPGHRLVLLKSAAEWIVARYQRGMENQVRQEAAWRTEKREWEAEHPDLTPEVRKRFTQIFKQLADPERGDRRGVRRKRPRICLCSRTRGNIDNCVYAGEKGHSPLCWNFVKFVERRNRSDKRFAPDQFRQHAEAFLERRHRGESRDDALRRLFRNSVDDQRFRGRWSEYLAALGLREQNLIQQRQLPHCDRIGGTWERSQCNWNPHTQLCNEYRRALSGFDDATLALEEQYREWRHRYLAAPRKPAFRLPSARDLPMPKIFGDGYHQIDFDRSVLRLRLDDMREGEWIEFGFIPWPNDYAPSKRDVRVTSIHVNFIGTRVRAGFRFDVPRRESRFACSQDEVDRLRSQQYPREADDERFLTEARSLLLSSFSGNPDAELRVLAVDLGMAGAHVALFAGRTYDLDEPIPIIKINRLYHQPPSELNPGSGHDRIRGSRKLAEGDPRGLVKEHVGLHLERIAAVTSALTAHRIQIEGVASPPGDHDARGLKRHVSWMVRDWARLNARQIIKLAEKHRCDLVVFESLRGNRLPAYDKLGDQSARKKQEGTLYAYGRVRRKVAEAAVERGMRVVTVPYFKSSQVCSECGHEQKNAGRLKKHKSERRFTCECGELPANRGKEKSGSVPTLKTPRGGSQCRCTLHTGSDANAARVIGRVFWGDIVLPRRNPGP
ncbi:MAG: transposase [Planctomycetia bacterium]|nr:MAG: transposase [Planctomycetia bacterium]